MQTLLEDVVHQVLLHYITDNPFTLAQLNAAKASQDYAYAYSEVSNKSGLLEKSIIRVDERYNVQGSSGKVVLGFLSF